MMKTYCLLLLLFFLNSFSTAQTNKNASLLINQSNNEYNNINRYLYFSADSQSQLKIMKEKKDPRQAMLLSALWPGLGQFYVGDPIKGTLMAVGQIALFVPFLDALSAAKTEKYGETQSYRAEVILAFMVGNLIYSVIDAGNTARTLNSGEGLSFQLNQSNGLPNSLGENISNDFCASIVFRICL